MNYLKKIMLAGAFLGLTGAVFAAPTHLVTTNNTHHGKVFAKIGAYKSPEPVNPGATRERPWNEVVLLCTVQRMPKTCTAEILVEHDKSHQTESLGFMTIDLTTGELSSKESHPSDHYSMSVTGNAHVQVTSSSDNF